jgi:rRNA processing protein Gar1
MNLRENIASQDFIKDSLIENFRDKVAECHDIATDMKYRSRDLNEAKAEFIKKVYEIETERSTIFGTVIGKIDELVFGRVRYLYNRVRYTKLIYENPEKEEGDELLVENKSVKKVDSSLKQSTNPLSISDKRGASIIKSIDSKKMTKSGGDKLDFGSMMKKKSI